MPQQTVYIRNEDMEAWKKVPHKSQLIHEAIIGYTGHATVPGVTTADKLQEEGLDEFDKFMLDYSKPGKRPPHPKYGYPCCHGKTPCKHWQWGGDEGAWVNSLTGETKDE